MSRALASRRRLAQWIARATVALIARVETRGLDRVPPPPALLVANHLGHLDPAFVVAHLSAPPEIIALDDLWRAPVAPAVLLYAPLRVHRDQVDRRVLGAALQTLRAGRTLLLYPEARISVTGALERARDGVGYIALRSRVPVVPIAITGTESVLTALAERRRVELTLTVGEPFHPAPDPRLPRRAQRQQATDQVMRRLAALLPVRYRGVYAEPG